MASQNLIPLIAILLLGIPHGAIDNILFLEKSQTSPLKFYTFYLSLIALNVIAWIYFPLITFIVFILISSYHFGQSQLNGEVSVNRILQGLMFFLWGFAVILSFLFFNLDELMAIAAKAENGMIPIASLLVPDLIFKLFIAGTILILLTLSFTAFSGRMSYKTLIIEMIILGAVYLSAYLFPFLIGFALFFTVLHSFKVMQEEFRHFYDKVKMQNILRFVKKLLPLTLLSILGIALLFLLICMELINLGFPLAMIIIISSITLPHVFVMERFYSD